MLDMLHYILVGTTNKMQRFTIFFITDNALHISGAATANGGSKQASLARTRCCVYSFWAPDDERRNRPKHVEHWQ
jgi:hypothetical protein